MLVPVPKGGRGIGARGGRLLRVAVQEKRQSLSYVGVGLGVFGGLSRGCRLQGSSAAGPKFDQLEIRLKKTLRARSCTTFRCSGSGFGGTPEWANFGANLARRVRRSPIMARRLEEAWCHPVLTRGRSCAGPSDQGRALSCPEPSRRRQSPNSAHSLRKPKLQFSSRHQHQGWGTHPEKETRGGVYVASVWSYARPLAGMPEVNEFRGYACRGATL